MSPSKPEKFFREIIKVSGRNASIMGYALRSARSI